MGKVVCMDAWEAERVSKLRDEALIGFQWGELSTYLHRVLEPTIRLLSLNRRHVIEEAVYRLAYESYFLGIRYSRRARRHPGFRKDPFRVEPGCAEETGRLLHRIAGDFRLSQTLEEWTFQSLWPVLEDILNRWFLRGMDYGILLRKQGLL